MRTFARSRFYDFTGRGDSVPPDTRNRPHKPGHKP
jgi:hypothetical protein